MTNKTGEGTSVIAEIVDVVHEYTGGQTYPLLKFVKHFMNVSQLQTDVEDNLQSQAFAESPLYAEVVRRCFGGVDAHSQVLWCAYEIFHGRASYTNLKPVVNSGFWDPKQEAFCSLFVTQYMFAKCPMPGLKKDPKYIDEKQDWLTATEQVIISGLEEMEPSDFVDPGGKIVENALSFNWGFRVKDMYKNLHIRPQRRAISRSRGSYPLVDFHLNSRLNTAVECVRNASEKSAVDGASAIAKHKKFLADGPYHQWRDRYVIFNFEMEKNRIPELPDERADRIFTYVHATNQLYRGATVIRPNVVKSLPPSRSFSAWSRSCIRLLRRM